MSLNYPECRRVYTYGIGSTAEQFITEILQIKNFKVKPHKVSENGVDICLENENVGIEIWNWRESHCYNSRFQSVVENLKPYKYKFLITSFISPETKSKFEMCYKDNPIDVIDLGFQILPKKYEDFYIRRRETKGKKFVSRRTRKICRKRLAPLFNVLRKKEACTSTSGAYVYNKSNLLPNSIPSFFNAIVLLYQNRNKSTTPCQSKKVSSEKTRKIRGLAFSKIIKVLDQVDQVLKSLKTVILRKSLKFYISRIKVLILVRK